MSSRLSIKFTSSIALISALAIGLTAFLNSGKFDRTLNDLERSRLQIVVGDIKANLETGLSFGLPLKSLENAQTVIDTQAKQDPNILDILVHDENGVVLFHSGTKKMSSTIPQAWQMAEKAAGEKPWFLKEENAETKETALVVASTLVNGISQDLGGVAIRYSMAAHQKTVLAVQEKLTLASLTTIFITVLLSYLGISILTRKHDQELGKVLVHRLLIFSLLLLMLSQAAISVFAWSSLEEKLAPEMDKQAATVGRLITSKLQRALAYKIPFEKILGIEEFFDDIRVENTDIRFLAISTPSGKVLSSSGIAANALDLALKNNRANTAIKTIKTKEHSGQTWQKSYRDTSVNLRHDGKDIAIIHIGMEQNYFTAKITDLRYDIAIILLSSLLIAFEILLFIITRDFSHPLHQISVMKEHIASKDFRVLAKVNSIRILTFLFMFAEMLSRPFLPIYARELLSNSTSLPNAILVSLPVTGFLFGMAISMPFAGRCSDRFGRRYGFIAGALLVALGLLVSGSTTHFYLLVLARTLSGIGYASMFMSCQGYVLDKTNDRNRAQGMASFVSAIMVAEICAPAIGGILADKIGVRLVFIFGAMIAITAATLAISILDNKNARRPATNHTILLPYQQLMRNRRFIALAFFSGIPAKLIYSAFLIYLVPLLLTDFSSTTSEIGRYAMTYGVAALLLSPVFAKVADRYQAHVAMVSCGGVLTGLGLVPIFFIADKTLVLLGIAALGIGQAMSISAQIALVGKLTQTEMIHLGSGSVLGVFRLIERLGAAAGPLIAGALVALFGVIPAVTVLGLYGLLSALFFTLIFIEKKQRTDLCKDENSANENSKHAASQNGGQR
ncbi:MAG: MFS transporter [Pseudomonadota bacterium]